MKLAKSVSIISGAVALLAAPVAFAADPVRPQALITPVVSNTINGNAADGSGGYHANPNNDGNHGSKSVDNSRNCTKEGPQNNFNNGNCPASK